MTTGIKNWSTTAGNNNSASPNGAPEGMPPGGVNNTIRQNMAEIRSWYEDYAWVDFGHTGIIYVDGTNFRVSGNQTSVYHVNRRIRAYGTTMGTLYGTITASSFLTNTTVTVLWDSGVLTSNLSEISVGIAVNTQALSMQCIKGFANAAEARMTLGLGTAATTDSSAYAMALQGAPTGMIGMFGRKTAPSGWVRLNGGTIGSASSGATERANADTQALFELLWGEYANTELAIQDNTGAASTRGASATADFAANKRLPLEDWATNAAFPRAWDGSRTFGTYQADAMQGHRHTISTGANSSMTTGFMQGNNGVSSPNSGDPITDGTNGTPRTANETRPKNRTALFCIKL